MPKPYFIEMMKQNKLLPATLLAKMTDHKDTLFWCEKEPDMRGSGPK
jgi:hypothetical protein